MKYATKCLVLTVLVWVIFSGSFVFAAEGKVVGTYDQSGKYYTGFSAGTGEGQMQPYYDFLESSIFTSKSQDEAYAEVASKYGITVDALKRLEAKSKYDEPTDWEVGVYRDLVERLKSLPQGYTNEQARSIYNEVASKYGIRRGHVHAIEVKCFEAGVPFEN